MIIPKYMLNFKCVGGSCEDNCCIGWDVDIDKKTYLKYQKVQDPIMKREIKKYIHVNNQCYDPLVDFAYASLDDTKRCQFLNSENLCMIHKHLGEIYLSNVCTNFPRITNKIDGEIEQSATPSCPEIARKLILETDAMHLIQIVEKPTNELLTYKIKQNDKYFQDTLISHLKTIRDFTLTLVLNENFRIEENLRLIAYFVEECYLLEKNRKLIEIDQLIEKYETIIQTKFSVNQFFESKPNDVSECEDFIGYTDYLLKRLDTIGAIDSERYISLSQKAVLGNYQIGAIAYENMTNQSGHILKNYFANHIFRMLFPFSEGENIREALWLMLIRFGIIKRQLIGLMGNGETFSLQSIAEYLQVVSKVIEHHKHFEVSMIEQLKKQKGQTKTLVTSLLQFNGN